MPDSPVILLVLAAFAAIALWAANRGSAPVDEEPPTLDTRNHLDD